MQAWAQRLVAQRVRAPFDGEAGGGSGQGEKEEAYIDRARRRLTSCAEAGEGERRERVSSVSCARRPTTKGSKERKNGL